MADCLPVRENEAGELWSAYRSASGTPVEPRPGAGAFGDSRELADELCDLVLVAQAGNRRTGRRLRARSD